MNEPRTFKIDVPHDRNAVDGKDWYIDSLMYGIEKAIEYHKGLDGNYQSQIDTLEEMKADIFDQCKEQL